MSVTIRDVAAAAGVSITTVSHVLSDQGRVSPGTRAAVLDAVARLGYRPNAHARSLVTRRTRILAIQMPSPPKSAECAVVPNSDYFLELLNGAVEAASERGYALIVTPPEAVRAALGAFAVDGAILVDPRGDEELFGVTGELRSHLVTTGRPIHRRRRVAATVDNDLVAAAGQLLDHLHGAGYRRPAVITTDTTRSYTADLVAGYMQWCSAHRLRPVVVECSEPPTPETAAAAFARLARRRARPDAVLTTSEDLALGVLHEAQRRGIGVPRELGLCSAVDAGSLMLTAPTITGLFVHPREVGRRAATALVDVLENRPVERSRVPVTLNVRESTRPESRPTVG